MTNILKKIFQNDSAEHTAGLIMLTLLISAFGLGWIFSTMTTDHQLMVAELKSYRIREAYIMKQSELLLAGCGEPRTAYNWKKGAKQNGNNAGGN